MDRTLVSVVSAAAAAVLVCATVGAAPRLEGPPMIGGDSEHFPELVALDAQGGRYVAGVFSIWSAGGPNVDFDPSEGTQIRTVVGWNDAYVTKFDADGSWVWTQTFGGTSEESAHSIVLAGGTLYVGGGFRSNDAGFGGAKGTISSHSAYDSLAAAYVMALDPGTGTPRASFGTGGVVTFGAAEDGHGNAKSLAVLDGTLFVAGDFIAQGFGIGGSGAVNGVGGMDGYVAAVDAATGAARDSFGKGGVQPLLGSADDVVYGVAAASGRVYVVGATVSADFGVGGAGSVAAAGPSDAFVVALDAASGAPATSFAGDGVLTIGGSGYDDARAVAAGLGHIYVTGRATGDDVRFDGEGAARPTLGGQDIYVTALDPATGTPDPLFAGGVQWFGSERNDSLDAVGLGVAGNGVYVGGRSAENSAFGVGGANQTGQNAQAFVFGLDAATGAALPGFARDGVATLEPGPDRSVSLAGFGAGPSAVAFVGALNSPDFAPSFDAGRASASLPEKGSYLILLDAATGAPLNMNLPVLLSPPIFSRNPVVAGQPVTAHVIVRDAKPLSGFNWWWGGRSYALGRTHVFAKPGRYPVQADAWGGRGRATSDVAYVDVVPAGRPYSDVTEATVRIDLVHPGNDTMLIRGRILAPGGLSRAGKVFAVDVGGVERSFVLGASGRSPRGDESVVVGAAMGGVAQFMARLRGSYAQQLSDEGMSAGAADRRYAPTRVSVTLDGRSYTETVPLVWTSDGVTGRAR